MNAGETLDEKILIKGRGENGPVVLPEAISAYGPDGKVLHVREHLDDEENLQWTYAEGTWKD